jgi:hypothetical protein
MRFPFTERVYHRLGKKESTPARLDGSAVDARKVGKSRFPTFRPVAEVRS